MLELPRLSVVTSCYNAEAFVDETIRSVVQQRYPKLEYIFVDGASTDRTLDIARQHGGAIHRLVSERDDGQYHGIQKGMALATGDVMGWLNGDDIHCPWTLNVVGEVFARFPDVQWIVGTPGYMNESGQCTRVSGHAGSAYPRQFIRNGWFRPQFAGYLQQESMFWRRSLWQAVGGLDLKLNLAGDFDLWRRFAEHADLYSVAVPLALFRQRPGVQRSSAGQGAYEAEVDDICKPLEAPPAWWRVLAGQSEVRRHLCRMMMWKTANVISYSTAQRQWVLTRSRRPLARTSLADLLLERSLRRTGPLGRRQEVHEPH